METPRAYGAFANVVVQYSIRPDPETNRSSNDQNAEEEQYDTFCRTGACTRVRWDLLPGKSFQLLRNRANTLDPRVEFLPHHILVEIPRLDRRPKDELIIKEALI